MRNEALHFALRNRKLVVGTVVVAVFLVAGVVGPMTIDHKPADYVGPAMAPPSGEFWFGTTTFGQDVFAQFLYGLRSTFLVGVLGGVLASVVGMVVGFVAGYRGGWVDELLTMVTNIVLVLPALVVLLIVNAYLGVRSVGVQALFIGLTSWPWAARAIRAQTFSLRSRDFVDLARLSGVRTPKIILREIAPNMSSYLFLTFILLFGSAILIAASLDFIGLGPTDSVSLGLMLNNAARWSALQLGMWWWFVPPGAGITAIVGALYVMNVGLDEVFNPKLREM
ncbi:ABC transporter permease [Microbispora triticiradicis]|uniref:ABC transporter permease n=3 Tax=Microbispora TaxID=2005 RepID=A0ABY3M4W7_9ACTN|nr:MULTISPECIES: ABC transporter permease [Microbispora]RGA06549.1 ABC transporter permease [Microbispora triticiradicis]TLP66778.1 ABC transporter permease [Microbispora fusca]TYB67406.1 ABC transporter permease [Microbispora tritici]GLW25713.1 peptide ABC transporter permease [Microbispora amethystogenes]